MVYRLATIQTQDIEKRWPEILPFVTRFLDESEREHSEHSIYLALVTGNMQCWTFEEEGDIKGLVVTEITIFPTTKVLQVIGCAGDGILDVVENILVIENWARYSGCTKIMCQGRVGWERVLKPYGWRKSYVVVMKDL